MRGDLEAVGAAISTFSVSDGGVGFIDGTYNNVTVYPLDSTGSAAELTVTISGNTITNAVVSDGGSGYRVGDTVGVTTSEVGGAGGDAVLTIDSIIDTDTLYLTNVDGEKMIVTESIKLYDTVTRHSDTLV